MPTCTLEIKLLFQGAFALGIYDVSGNLMKRVSVSVGQESTGSVEEVEQIELCKTLLTAFKLIQHIIL